MQILAALLLVKFQGFAQLRLALMDLLYIVVNFSVNVTFPLICLLSFRIIRFNFFAQVGQTTLLDFELVFCYHSFVILELFKMIFVVFFELQIENFVFPLSALVVFENLNVFFTPYFALLVLG